MLECLEKGTIQVEHTSQINQWASQALLEFALWDDYHLIPCRKNSTGWEWDITFSTFKTHNEYHPSRHSCDVIFETGMSVIATK